MYNTISEGFRWVKSISLEQLKSFYKEEYGSSGMKDLPERLWRADEEGCSSMFENLESLLICNRAGPNESKLTYEEIIQEFLS